MADLSTLTNEELQAMRNGDFSKISNEKVAGIASVICYIWLTSATTIYVPINQRTRAKAHK
jgi:hypothetical protein